MMGAFNHRLYVALRQFGIDDCCLSPKTSLEETPWQPGPYYDADVKAVENEWIYVLEAMTERVELGNDDEKYKRLLQLFATCTVFPQLLFILMLYLMSLA